MKKHRIKSLLSIILCVAVSCTTLVFPSSALSDKQIRANATIELPTSFPLVIKHTATKLTGGQYKLTWNTKAEATNYKITYSTKKDGTYKALKTIKNNESKKTLSYTTKGLPKGTYYFKVTAQQADPKFEVIKYGDGAVYYGLTTNGKPDHYGMIIYADGSAYCCEWKYGEKLFAPSEYNTFPANQSITIGNGDNVRLFTNKDQSMRKAVITYKNGDIYVGMLNSLTHSSTSLHLDASGDGVFYDKSEGVWTYGCIFDSNYTNAVFSNIGGKATWYMFKELGGDILGTFNNLYKRLSTDAGYIDPGVGKKGISKIDYNITKLSSTAPRPAPDSSLKYILKNNQQLNTFLNLGIDLPQPEKPATAHKCSRCNGSGRLIDAFGMTKPCHGCLGTGISYY